MERSGTLAEPSDNSTTPYIKKRPTLLGQPQLYLIVKLYNNRPEILPDSNVQFFVILVPY